MSAVGKGDIDAPTFNRQTPKFNCHTIVLVVAVIAYFLLHAEDVVEDHS